MKKTLYVLSALVIAACSLTGCENKKVGNSKAENAAATTAEEVTAASTLEPDPLAPTEAETTAEAPAVTTVVTTEAVLGARTEIVNEEEQPDPLGGGAFEYNADGAVVFEGDYSTQSDRVLLSAAQALFESACRTNWNYTVGCPYSIDTNNYIENDFGWQYYLINDGYTTSLADVKNDYYKVFSDRYPADELSELYLDGDNGVYALSADRGMNIFYSYSKVTEIGERGGDEIFFTVENYYDGSDKSSEPYSRADTFSVVIGSDGVWRAGQFTLPY